MTPPREAKSPCSAESHVGAARTQTLHRIEVAINRGAEGKTGRYFVPDISEERAVELASRFVSESFLFSVRDRPLKRPFS